MRPNLAVVPLLALGLIGASCSSSGSGGAVAPSRSAAASADRNADSAGPGGSLWDRLDAARAARTSGGGAAEVVDAGAGAAEIPAAERGRYESWWKLYLTEDQSWPAAKADWRRSPPPGPQLLAENLLRRHVLSYDAGVRYEFERSRRELVGISDVAAPIIVVGLQRSAGDSLVRRHAIELLGAMGPSVLGDVEKATAEASPGGRVDLVRAMGRMKSPATTRALASIATGGGAFEARIEAVKGLSENGDTAGYPAVVSCLADSDPSVRKFAARYIPSYANPESAKALVGCMERCERERDREGVAEAHAALKKLTGLEAPPESGAWRATLGRVGATGR